jgi:phage FluMu protein Com
MTMIDRDELLKKIAPMSLSNGSVLGHHSGTADVIAEMIQNAPAIDPESLRGHAKWVKDENVKIIDVDAYGSTFESPAVYCENCNAALSEADFKSHVWNFCPVCGFKMEGETEEQHETD